MARVEVMPPPARPSAAISVHPDVIDRGQRATLQWTSTHADRIEISGLGRVEASGERIVSPPQSTTYTEIARGPGGEATASTRVTVNEPAPPAPPVPPAPTRDIGKDFASTVSTIYFTFDNADLDDEAQAELRQAAERLRRSENRLIVFKIEGNCDERGTEEYNIGLGDRRANAAKEFLMNLGISPERIRTISYGKERPADPGHTERAWALNRRDDFVYVEGGDRVVTTR